MTAKASHVRESSRIGLNLASMVTSRFLCLALSLVQSGIIFRALGVEGSGQYGFALNYPALFCIFATLGIHRLLMRDIARDPSIAWTYVWTATGVMLMLSVVVTGGVMASMTAIEPNPVTRQAVFMSSLSVVVLYALQRPFESLLMARERMFSIACVNVVGAIARLAGTCCALRLAPTSVGAHAGIAAGNLVALAAIMFASIALTGWERPHFKPSLAWKQVVESNAFTVAALLSMIYFKADMSLLKWLNGDTATGIYTATQRVTEPLLMIAGIWGTTVFPALCRLSVTERDNYTRVMHTSARLALMVAFPMAFGIGALAQPIIVLLTGAGDGGFSESVTVLRVLCIVTPSFYLNSVSQEFLYANHRNWAVVKAYFVGCVVDVALNLFLIPRFGAMGAAMAAVVANYTISAIFVHNMLQDFRAMRLLGMTFKTLIACTVMGIVAYQLSGVSLVLAVAAGALVYVVLQAFLGTLLPDERGLVVRLAAVPFKRRVSSGK